MIGINNTLTEMKKVFGWLISRLNTAKKKNISELENMVVETFKHEYKQKKEFEIWKRISRTVSQLPELSHTYNQNFTRKRKRTEEIFEVIMAKNFPKLTINYKPNSKNTKQDKYQKNETLYLRILYSNCIKRKTKRKSWRKENQQQQKKKPRKIKTIQKNHNFKMLQTKMCIILRKC